MTKYIFNCIGHKIKYPDIVNDNVVMMMTIDS